MRTQHCHRGAETQEGDRNAQIYANAPVMMFVPEWTVVATQGNFINILCFFLVDNSRKRGPFCEHLGFLLILIETVTVRVVVSYALYAVGH